MTKNNSKMKMIIFNDFLGFKKFITLKSVSTIVRDICVVLFLLEGDNL